MKRNVNLLVFIGSVVIVSKAVREYQLQILDEIFCRLVLYTVEFVLHCTKIHSLFNNMMIVRSLRKNTHKSNNWNIFKLTNMTNDT